MAGGRDRRSRPGAQARKDAGEVFEPHETFERQWRRHTRLSRLLRQGEAEAEALQISSGGRVTVEVARERVGYHDLWSRWSQSYDDVAATAGRLLQERPRALADVSRMFSALEWMLLSDGTISDVAAERQVRRFARGLRQLAGEF